MSGPIMVELPGFPGMSVHRDSLGGYHIENPNAQRSRDRYGFALSLAEVARQIKSMKR